MNSNEDFLFGLLAVQTGLVDAVAFLDVWGSLREDGPALPELLVQHGLILPEDREHLAYLVRRKLPPGVEPRSVATVAPQPHANRYRYLDRCGTGGMGEVWRARDTCLDREVAIKELKRSLADDSIIRYRFAHEARITCQLDHPGIVPVYDLLPEQDGRPRYIMRLLRGRTLSEAIVQMHQRRRAGADVALERAELLQAFVAVCNTIGYAHSRGVLHRDLKPANVQLGDYGEVVVLDWGLAGTIRNGQTSGDDLEQRATMPGHVFGTPEYMSPEQASGDVKHIDQRSDIYGLGAILYQMLTGSPPFHGSSLGETLALVRDREPTPIRELWAEVPDGLAAICHKALSKQPEDRYAEATDLAAAVLQWQESERREVERALRESEELYRTLTEAIPQSVWIRRPDGFIEYINRPSLGDTESRWDREQFLGMGWRDLFHPEDLAAHWHRFQQAQKDGVAYESQYRLRLPNGNYRWYLSRALPMRDTDGVVVRWFGTSMDIHEFKEAVNQRDEALALVRTSEERYRLLTDLIPQNVWTARPDGLLDYANQRGLDYHGLALREGGGEEWHRVVHPDDLPRCLARWQQSMASGEPYEIQFRLRNAGGEYRWYLSRAIAIRGNQGQITQWFGTNTDIEDLKRAEQDRDEALARAQSSEQRYRLLAEMIPHTVWTVSPDGIPDYVNQRGLDLAGFDLEDIGSDGWQRLIHPEDLAGFLTRWRHSLATGEPFENECRIRTTTAEYRWYLTRAIAVHDDQGHLTKWFGTNTDIDDLKRVEQERDEALDRLRVREEEYRSLIEQIPQGSGTFPNGSATISRAD